jgi:hypothetical protein
VRLAADVRTDVTGKWIFKKPVTRGRDAFNAAWAAALVEEVDFEYSGYVLGDYLDAQERVNGVRTEGAVRRSPDAEQAVHGRYTFRRNAGAISGDGGTNAAHVLPKRIRKRR